MRKVPARVTSDGATFTEERAAKRHAENRYDDDDDDAAAAKTAGQSDYEADVLKRPRYDDGTPRKTWAELDDLARWSWGRGA